MKVVISAGGKGSRIADFFPDIPKPLIELDGKSVLEHQIEKLKNQGFDDIIITVGHMGDKIKAYLGDGSEKHGVKIEYFTETEPLGTAGALTLLYDKLSDDFVLLNGDLFFDADINRLVAFHKEKNALATVYTHPNSHPYDSTLIVSDGDGRVSHFVTKEKRQGCFANRVNAGIHILSKKVLDGFQKGVRLDLDRDILLPLASEGHLFCLDTSEYIKDMGTPERYNAVLCDIKNRIHEKLSRRTERRAVFLDRDGTLNVYKGFLTDINDLELCDGAAEAVRLLNSEGCLSVVVTNQPVVARGEVTEKELEHIHNKLETLLGDSGAYLNAIYYCPHHPDKGFEGEVPELKIKCSCRKPDDGMFRKAAVELGIDLSASFTVGDSEADILAGRKAGTKTILIGSGDYGQDYTVKTILEAIQVIINEK